MIGKFYGWIHDEIRVPSIEIIAFDMFSQLLIIISIFITDNDLSKMP